MGVLGGSMSFSMLGVLAQPLPAKWINWGQPAHNPPHGLQAIEKGKGKAVKVQYSGQQYHAA
eukprot:365696-Chlamydomonas_euryale.AAC.11